MVSIKYRNWIEFLRGDCDPRLILRDLIPDRTIRSGWQTPDLVDLFSGSLTLFLIDSPLSLLTSFVDFFIYRH